MSASRDVRSRSQRDPLARGRLTDRDRLVIQTVALHGAASRSLLTELGFFSSVSRANRRMRFLFDGSFLRRTTLAVSPYSLETVYVLGANGVAVAAEDDVIDQTELSRHSKRQPERAYLEHQLGVLSLRVAVLGTPVGVEVSEFLSEPECRHEYQVVRGRRKHRRIVKPDGYFEVEATGDRSAFFIEYDRGNCSLPQMAGVFERYGNYAKDGAFREVYGLEGFQVLLVTTAGDRRINHLAKLARNCGVTVRFATVGDIRSKGFYGPVWCDGHGRCAGVLIEGFGGMP